MSSLEVTEMPEYHEGEYPWQKCPQCKGNPIYTEVPAEEHRHHRGLLGIFFRAPIPFPHTDIDWQCRCGASGHATRSDGAIVSIQMRIPR